MRVCGPWRARFSRCGNMWDMRKLICALAVALTIAPPLARAQEVQPAQPAQEYVLGPDSQRQPGVPQGKVAKHEWTSKIYPRYGA